MTVAISLKVHDGLVLATDSASTLIGTDANGQTSVVNIYNHANKICNLYKGLPIGLMTWGAGSIGPSSIGTIAKDLRRAFQIDDRNGLPPKRLDPREYTIKGVAEAVRDFFEVRYRAEPAGTTHGTLGLLVGGYSASDGSPEEYLLHFNDGVCASPTLLRPARETGVGCWGQPEAVSRLMFGVSLDVGEVLEQLGLPIDQIEPAVVAMREQLEVPLVRAPMPIQDAIDLAEFFVYLTATFSRFCGAPTVGGPIEVAVITKHEGFKWVKRKHYFRRKFNRRAGDIT